MNAKDMQIAFETSAKIIDSHIKPLTSDIFYYINLAQNNYVKRLCDEISIDKDIIQVNSKINELQSLVTKIPYFTTDAEIGILNPIEQPTVPITINANPSNKVSFNNLGIVLPLPNDFTMYISSNSTILNQNLDWLDTINAYVVKNNLVEEEDINNSVHASLFNSFPILRNCLVTLSKNKTVNSVLNSDFGSINVYTGGMGLLNVELTYIRIPADMSLSTPTIECELPTITHNTIVDMAIDYYLTSNTPSNNANQNVG